MNRDAIKAALNRIGHGLSSADATTVGEAWAAPAMVFSDAGAMVVGNPAQLADMFKRSIQSLKKRDLVATRPEIEQVDELNQTLCMVRVRWPAFDRNGIERASERSFYLMEVADDGARIRVALTVTEQE